MKARIGRRGQGALEYMMTYGWTILIVGVVAVVLWQMGVFNPATTPPGCTGFSQIKPIDWKVSKADKLMTITILNDAGTKVTISQLNASFYSSPSCQMTTPAFDLRAGQSTNLTIDLTACDNELPTSRDYYRADLTLTYNNIASGISHNSVGECHGTVE